MNGICHFTVINLYRLANPLSRAQEFTSWNGSTGIRRIASCIFCGESISSSAKWPETVRSENWRYEHGPKCAKYWYLREGYRLKHIENWNIILRQIYNFSFNEKRKIVEAARKDGNIAKYAGFYSLLDNNKET